MKVSYVLRNHAGKSRKIPAGEAWQWHHFVEDEAQANAVLADLKKKIRENRLQLANLFVDKLSIRDFQKLKVQFTYKGEVQYDDQLRPKRIINQHEDSPEQ
ncbi:MAG: hypothetical protein ACI9LD_001801 [Polaromonas sp.]|jgi:hypothetical protein